ncbi:MAG: hypothetical protein ACPG5B_01710 [Chitinophagales bacterium]
MQLSDNWITEGILDFEYKKYILLGYLKEVNRSFDEKKLYPFLSDLIFHYRNLRHLNDSKKLAKRSFPKKIDVENFSIVYENIMHDAAYMKEVERILDFALPKMEQKMYKGKEIYEAIDEKLQIFPVGIMPLMADEGYLLLKNGETSDTQVFDYKITIFANANENYRAIRTKFITSYIRKFTNTYENIKLDLMRQHKDLPNPATFVIMSAFQFPLQETLLPIAKRSFVRFVKKYHQI